MRTLLIVEKCYRIVINSSFWIYENHSCAMYSIRVGVENILNLSRTIFSLKSVILSWNKGIIKRLLIYVLTCLKTAFSKGLIFEALWTMTNLKVVQKMRTLLIVEKCYRIVINSSFWIYENHSCAMYSIGGRVENILNLSRTIFSIKSVLLFWNTGIGKWRDYLSFL